MYLSLARCIYILKDFGSFQVVECKEVGTGNGELRGGKAEVSGFEKLFRGVDLIGSPSPPKAPSPIPS
jgi:hypothetical protein